MGLQQEMKEFIEKNFGVYSAAKIDEFAKTINPEEEPKEFLDKCVDFVGTLMGEEAAKNKLSEFYKKYS